MDWNKWFGSKVFVRKSAAASVLAHSAAAAPVATTPPRQAEPLRKAGASNQRLLLVVALQAALIIGLTWALVYFARDEYNAMVEREEEEIETPSRVSTQAGAQQGAPVITLSVPAQRANGVATRPLQAHRATPSAQLFGTVLDPAPLFEARMKYFAALDEARVIRAQLTRSEAEFQRADSLFRDDRSVSQRVVQEAQAAWRGDQAKLAASSRLAAELAANMRQQWGERLAGSAAQRGAALTALAGGREVIVQIALPAQDAAPQRLAIAPLGAGADESNATLIGPAPRADNQFAGSTYFYRAAAGALRIGMQVSARHDGGQSAQGVLVPREAVVWHGGKSWVYVKEGAQAYARQEVAANEALDAGWFAQQGLTAGQEVVVSGAQLLLSEEFRYQIRNENDD